MAVGSVAASGNSTSSCSTVLPWPACQAACCAARALASGPSPRGSPTTVLLGEDGLMTGPHVGFESRYGATRNGPHHLLGQSTRRLAHGQVSVQNAVQISHPPLT